ncbi:MAG: neutral/alkaline non-lysosomal ceramidase N-terminal domain-containing protein [Armatimonadota bacterium]
MPLTAGTAIADLTPPPGEIIACFPDRSGDQMRPRVAEGTHDRLEARVLALSDGQQHLSLCGLDLPGIRHRETSRIRERVAEARPDIAGPGIVLACSHTHSGPDTLYLFGGSPDDPWVDEMVEAVADAIIRAHDALSPVTLSVARAPLALNHNRRAVGVDGRMRMIKEYEAGVDESPVDPDVTVLRADNETGEPIAIAFHYTAHALTLGAGNLCFSADYPGVARSVVDASLSTATSVFLNGAAGNVHPRMCMRSGREATEAIGTELGRAVVMLSKEAQPVTEPALGASSRTLTFANRMDPSLQVPVEVSCLRIGPLLVGVVPGEYFVEFQLRFRDRVDAELATLIGYANGWPGYIPTREAYAEGGYGVEAYPEDPSDLSRTCLPRGAGEKILNALVALAGELS